MKPEQMLATLLRMFEAQEAQIADLKKENRTLLRRLDETLDDLHALRRRMAPFDQREEA